MERDSEIVNNFDSDEEELQEENEENMLEYNQNEFQFEKIYKKLIDIHLLQKEFQCAKCGKIMVMVNDNSTIDKKIFRCRGNNPIHDSKINIRKNSIYEGFQIPLYILYYLTLECFPFNVGVNKSLIEIDGLCKKINKPSTTNKTIIKLFQLLREKIRIKYHEEWKKKPLGMEPSTNGVPRVEIDESEIIGNQNKILWMFGMIDRADKEARVFCVMNNRTKENLLPIIKENIYTYNENENEENEDSDENNNLAISLKTRIYSDCYSVYQTNDFKDMGYILHRVNHSVWFGQGLFHTNSIEGLWSQIKRLSNNFSGLTINQLENMENNGINIKNYLDGWICYALFLRMIEKRKLSKLNTQNYLIDFLKIY